MIIYLNKEAVIKINKSIMNEYAQPHAVVAEANLDYFLERVKHYGENITKNREKLLKKAAFLLYHLAYDAHIFSDGNKRTALSTASVFLTFNSNYIVITSREEQEKMARFVKSVAEGKESLSSNYKWLNSVVKKL